MVVQFAKNLDIDAEFLSNTGDGVAFLDYIYGSQKEPPADSVPPTQRSSTLMPKLFFSVDFSVEILNICSVVVT